MARLFIVVNEDRFFLSHRKDIATAAIAEGYEVTVVAKDTGRKEEIIALGAKYIDLPVNPTGMNIGQELKTYRFLKRLFRKEKPDIVHNVGVKLMLWGGLAAKLTKVPLPVSAVSGLGVMFSESKLPLCTRAIILHNRKSTYVIFQNEDDRQLFLEHKVVRSEQAYFIKGSGVDLKDFIYTSEPDSEKLNVIFTARMVKEKGVLTLVEAAELLRKDYEDKVEFWLCGGLSNNPRAIGQEKLQALCDGKYIQWLGYRTDVRELLMKSHIVAFPSYYREGLPKSLIEASAVGRPIITTDSVGCRDVVEDGVNGFIIPIKDAIALADKLRTLLDNRALRISMGRKSREFAVRDFSIDEVIGTHLEIYSMVYGAIQCRK